MNFGAVIAAAAFVATYALPHTTAHAEVINVGFNITPQNVTQVLTGSDSAAIQVPFYDSGNGIINDNAGTSLAPANPPFAQNDAYSITFDAAAVFGGRNFQSGTLLSMRPMRSRARS